MEFQRKFLVNQVPDLSNYSNQYITQGYISTDPIIRIRQVDDQYFVAMKSFGHLVREKFRMPINKEQFESLEKKIESHFIRKSRYFIPIGDGLTAKLDIYEEYLDGLLTIEVNFESRTQAEHFSAPEWFGPDITHDSRYRNNNLAKFGIPE
ncbi:adenylate cyclase [Candidatus Epulonipiscium fishelsonii]|uniref:Adenylate cyclase n=1 Tax=Candidatus Epulonipiscium fishelsonii TaxID=77094 RepID=A0ACC8X8P1_9FIRM|nr:adenylate cyclase [Epulopiscium sp. SCG-B11WGA-EpuloA1]ONI39735.1 adenylate cyclase [Epulopiscium sp. SCG-B05WGA-EpuloA1]